MNTTASITYWTVALKSWEANWVNDLVFQEKYGNEECGCDWNKFLLSTTLVDLMQCYQPTIFIPGTPAIITSPATISHWLTDNCYTALNESQIKKIFQLASQIINDK